MKLILIREFLHLLWGYYKSRFPVTLRFVFLFWLSYRNCLFVPLGWVNLHFLPNLVRFPNGGAQRVDLHPLGLPGARAAIPRISLFSIGVWHFLPPTLGFLFRYVCFQFFKRILPTPGNGRLYFQFVRYFLSTFCLASEVQLYTFFPSFHFSFSLLPPFAIYLAPFLTPLFCFCLLG